MIKRQTKIELVAIFMLFVLGYFLSAHFESQKTNASITEEAAFYGINIKAENSDQTLAISESDSTTVDDEAAFFWGR